MIYYEYIIKYYSLMASRSEQQWDCSKLQAYVEYDERNNNSIIVSIPESSCTYDMWQKTRGAWSIIAIKIISNNNKVIMIIIIVTSYFTLIDKWLLSYWFIPATTIRCLWQLHLHEWRSEGCQIRRAVVWTVVIRISPRIFSKLGGGDS